MSLSFMRNLDDGEYIYTTYFESIIQSLQGRYVKEGCEVEKMNGMNVKINEGIIVYDGQEYQINETILQIPPSLVDEDRADVIVWDYNNGNPEFKILKGQRWLNIDVNIQEPITERINDEQIPLAIVIVRENAVNIDLEDIIDVRTSSKIVSAKSYGYTNFDNNSGGVWKRFVSILINSTVTEHIQYKIEIDNNIIKVYSNNLSQVLISGNGGNDFWNNVQNDGRDIRVFDESYNQNYFWIEEFDYTNKKAIIWVKINAGQEQVNIAFGNNDCSMSSFNNGDMTFERVINNLFGCWQFNEGQGNIVYDSSGNNNHGTIYGNATWTNEGLQFDGIDDYVELPDIGNPNQLSLCVKIKPFQLGARCIVERGSPSIVGWHFFIYGYDKLFTNFHSHLYTDSILSVNNTYSVGVVWDGTYVKIYCNGNEEASAYAKPLRSGGDKIYIGARQGTKYLFNGIIKDIFIFNKALSQEEFQDLYNNYGIGGYNGKCYIRKYIFNDLQFGIPFIQEF